MNWLQQAVIVIAFLAYTSFIVLLWEVGKMMYPHVILGWR